MFKEHAGEDIIDNIKFCYDMGFRGMFDNGLMGLPGVYYCHPDKRNPLLYF